MAQGTCAPGTEHSHNPSPKKLAGQAKGKLKHWEMKGLDQVTQQASGKGRN